MINKWNNIVSNNDLVFHLGDFGFGSYDQIKKIRSRLNGTIFLIAGNHDRKRIMKKCGFILSPTDKIRINNIVLTHRPLPNVHDGIVNVHGHIHNKKTKGRRINVSVDVTNFEPRPIERYFKEANKFLIK
jgi:calcineurin-like phosphoesterase family protein